MSKPSWIGQTIGGRYDIRELLGQGGMSAVYKAYDPNLRRVVALKLIHAHLSTDPEFVRRFQEEGAAVAQLRHNNIIQVYDFNHDGDTYFIVFEFIPGESLQQRVKRLAEQDRKMPFDQTVEIAASVADALDYAHSRSMIHRDIKPANVMLNVQGQAILMDFGIVKIMGGDSHTATGAVVGTARYMAPEQIRGVQVDGRADIYSVGVMLYEMVSGNPPFKADSAMTLMMMHVNDPIPDLRGIRPDTPTDLVQIINKALAKDPAQRYQKAGELARDLRAANLAPPGAIDATRIESPTFQPPVGATVLETAPRPGAVSATRQAAPAGTAVGSAPGTAVGAPPTTPPGGHTAAEQPQGNNRKGMLAIGGIVALVLLILCIVGGIFVMNALNGENETNETPIAEVETTTAEAVEETATEVAGEATETAVEATDTAEPEPTATNALPPTDTPEPTATLAPTDTPEPSPTPSPTIPAGPYVQINGIAIENGRYIVNFETFEYVPAAGDRHIHFFFNTVPPEQAGVGPNQATWFVFTQASPFTGYTTADRPAQATQMCALVANANHTINLGTGNCVNLPTG